MEINYSLVAIVVFAVVITIIILIRSNKKDQVDLEETLNKQELKPEEKQDEELKS